MFKPGCTIIAIRKNGRYLLASNSDNPWHTRTRVRIKQGKNFKFIGTGFGGGSSFVRMITCPGPIWLPEE
ncbi:hypothetical protein QF028_000362 [Neobacillus sp. B4I6]|uniref:hypothetical protein n=1 Tax=Neobacillus sp. B4I6 TaxID=3373925 RepID=UPI003D1D0B7A